MTAASAIPHTELQSSVHREQIPDEERNLLLFCVFSKPELSDGE
jgi:hypothetical protein